MKKYLDENGLIMMTTMLKGELNNKVEKVEGKGLSTNDLTNDLLEKINNAGDSSFNGDYNNLTNKPTIPSNVSQLTNDSDFQTADQVNSLINNKVSSVMKYKGSVSSMNDLPSNATIGDVYNIETEGTNNSAGDNAVWNGTGWDVLAGMVDLSDYYMKSELTPMTNDEIAAIFGGLNEQ